METKKQTKGKQAPAPVPTNYTSSVMVKWHEKADSKADQDSKVFLLPEKCNLSVKDGWRIYDQGELEPPTDIDEESYVERLDRMQWEVEFLCCKKEK